MKSLCLLALALLAGTIIGVAAAQVRLGMVPWESLAGPRAPGDPDRAPCAVIDSPEFDFGHMDLSQEGRHEFVIRNIGTAPLRMESGPTTCSCTLASLGQSEVPPGGATKVTMQWKSKGEPGEYQQAAVIVTNDPQRSRIELKVFGVMQAAVRAKPSELIFPQLSATESTTETLRLYGFRPAPLEITGHEFADSELAKYFGVEISPLPPEEVREVPGATSGVLARITVKSGLPQGALRQTITLTINLADRATIAVPIQGNVVSDINLFGPGWDSETKVLNIGNIPRKEGCRRNLTILVRGSRAQSVQFEVLETQPSTLSAVLAAPQLLRGGSAMQTTLTVQIPPNGPPGRFVGTPDSPFGRIRIRTTHPEIPELLILVSFVIESSPVN